MEITKFADAHKLSNVIFKAYSIGFDFSNVIKFEFAEKFGAHHRFCLIFPQLTLLVFIQFFI